MWLLFKGPKLDAFVSGDDGRLRNELDVEISRRDESSRKAGDRRQAQLDKIQEWMAKARAGDCLRILKDRLHLIKAMDEAAIHELMVESAYVGKLEPMIQRGATRLTDAEDDEDEEEEEEEDPDIDDDEEEEDEDDD